MTTVRDDLTRDGFYVITTRNNAAGAVSSAEKTRGKKEWSRCASEAD